MSSRPMRRPPIPNRPSSGRLSAGPASPQRSPDRQPPKEIDPEVEQIARELLKGRELSTVDPSLHNDLIAPLTNARNRALLRRSSSTIKRIDALVSKINSSQPKKTKVVRRQSQPKRTARPRSSSLVKMSTEEQEMYENVVDQLLAGETFEEIDAEALPKMRQVLKERIQKASAFNDYKTAKQLQVQMDKLVVISRSMPTFVPKPMPKQEFVDEMIQVYIRSMVRVIRLQRRYDREINDTQESKSVSSRASSRASWGDGDQGSTGTPGRSQSVMGPYRPSRALADLRERQERAFAEGKTAEAEDMKQSADAIEEIERKQWAERATSPGGRRGKSERERLFEELWKRREKDIKDRMLPQIKSAQSEADKALSQLRVYGIDIPEITEEIIMAAEEEDAHELEEGMDGPETLDMNQFPVEEEEEEVHSSDFEMLHNSSTSDDAQYSNGGYDMDNDFDDVSSVFMEPPQTVDVEASLLALASSDSEGEEKEKNEKSEGKAKEEKSEDKDEKSEEKKDKDEKSEEKKEKDEKSEEKKEKDEKSEEKKEKSEGKDEKSEEKKEKSEGKDEKSEEKKEKSEKKEKKEKSEKKEKEGEDSEKSKSEGKEKPKSAEKAAVEEPDVE